MNWWNQTRLADLRGRLITRLRRWFLPYSAVFTTDLASMARSWVLRTWLALTLVLALLMMLDLGDSRGASRVPGGVVLAALLHPVDSPDGEAHKLRDLLKSYVVIWSSFVIVLTAGTISSELGVVADSILSRGISRWQYFLGKWTARLTAVLGAYLLVVIPVAAILFVSARPVEATSEAVTPAEFTEGVVPREPETLPAVPALTLGGVACALTQVAALLAFVVTCGVACSASFDSTVISIVVGWVSLYSSGVILSVLDITRFSPARMLRDLPDTLQGRYVVADQCWLIGGWLAVTLAVTLSSGVFFARRDV